MKTQSPVGKAPANGSGSVTIPSTSIVLPTTHTGSANLNTVELDTSLSITIKNGIATISGTTPSASSARRTATMVAGLYGVRRVINLLSVNNNH